MLLFILLITQAFAQNAPDAVVWTSGSIDNARALFGPQANVVVMSREDNARAEREAGYLPPPERDSMFRKIGIETRVNGMDEFEKDMLMMGARVYTVRELKSEYPMLSEKQIKKLKAEMGKVK